MPETYIQIFKDRTTLSLAAAEHFAETVTDAVTKRGRFLAALAGGNTPLPLFRLLAEPHYRQQLPWSQLVFFWGDKRFVSRQDESYVAKLQAAMRNQFGGHAVKTE